MKKWKITAVCCALLFALGALTIVPPIQTFADECGQIQQKVLRLHILANSDSDADQQLKLKVRDAVLEESRSLFEGAQSMQQAKQSAQEHFEQIRATALRVIHENGYDYDAEVEICNMFFTTRTYDNQVSLPAGRYDALRITIGNAGGRNWWCVMFPPLCLPAATQGQPAPSDTAQLEDVLTDGELDITQHKEKYEFRFAVVEFFGEIAEMVRGWFGS